MDLNHLFAIAIPAFATLFVVIDPIGLSTLYTVMAQDMSAANKRGTAVKAVLFAGTILVVFALGGQKILDFLGISLPAFRISGGLLLFMLAFEMLFEKRTERRERNVTAARDEQTATIGTQHDDRWVFPLGTPLIAGPGAMASVILLMSQHHDTPGGQMTVIAVLAAVLALTLILFLLAGKFGHHITPSAARAMTRILGMILAALAVQFVLTGLQQAGFIAGVAAS